MNYKKNKSNVDLICNISELSAIFNKASRLDNLLGKVVEMIADHMRVSVCSVYLFEDNRDELVLSATAGPDTEKVGEVRFKSQSWPDRNSVERASANSGEQGIRACPF